MIRNNRKLLGISAFSIVLMIMLDQLTKYLASSILKPNGPFTLIPGVLKLQYLENQSAAFSMDPVSLIHKIFHISYFDEHPDAFLQTKMIFFVVLTVIIVFLLILLLCRIPDQKRFLWMDIVVVALIAGAIGNLIDRIVQNYVVDFIYFSLIDFPIFNVADIYVTCAAFGLVFLVIFYYKDADFEELFPTRKNDKKRG